MKEDFLTTQEMGMGNCITPMATDMKVVLNKERKKDMAPIFSKMETNMWGLLKMEYKMEQGNIIKKQLGKSSTSYGKMGVK